ncbi:MAG: SCO family protein [Microthrixaceae bacterium]
MGIAITSRKPIMALVVAALLMLATSCGGDKSALRGVVHTPPTNVADVKLNDVSSEPAEAVSMKADPGGLLLVYFGYTFCPDICPTSLSDLSVALKALPQDLAKRVTPAFVTVDPERDTPEALRKYMTHFFDNGMPLQAADAAALDAATEAFGVRYEVAEHQAGDKEYEVSHSASTYVIDDNGTVVVEWPFGFESEYMTSDIKHLLED